MTGHFSEESLRTATALLPRKTYDFTRCMRPNGTFYGSNGQCRKGVEAMLEDNAGFATGARGGVIGGRLFRGPAKEYSKSELMAEAESAIDKWRRKGPLTNKKKAAQDLVNSAENIADYLNGIKKEKGPFEAAKEAESFTGSARFFSSSLLFADQVLRRSKGKTSSDETRWLMRNLESEGAMGIYLN